MTDIGITIIELINNAFRNMSAKPLNLGGISGSGGGSGGPPGGFVGYLPQTRVAYDYSELEDSGLPASGWSLLDNLNHIRYDIAQISGGGGGIEEAPIDGTPYVREDAGWISMPEPDVEEAPIDGTPYSRQDAGWVASPEPGIEEAPIDGTPYARQDAGWVSSSGGGAATFLDLTDTPDSYAGHVGESVVVNASEDGLDFILVSGGAGTVDILEIQVFT